MFNIGFNALLLKLSPSYYYTNMIIVNFLLCHMYSVKTNVYMNCIWGLTITEYQRFQPRLPDSMLSYVMLYILNPRGNKMLIFHVANLNRSSLSESLYLTEVLTKSPLYDMYVCPLLILVTTVIRMSCWFLFVHLVKILIYLPHIL